MTGSTRRLQGALVLAVALLAGCTATSREVHEEAVAPDALRLYVFDCGRIRVASLELFGLADGDTDVREMAVPCYLVEHPAGRLLWEAGLPTELADEPGWRADPNGLSQRLERTLVEQIADLGLAPTDVDFLAMSHFHSDHVGAAAAFTGATLLIQEEEARAAFGPHASSHFFDPELYAALADGPVRRLTGRHDVFGDERVVLLPAPGHTPGHQVLFLDLEKTGPLLLAGDLYHFEASRRLRAVPLFNHDREQSLASMDRIEVYAEQRGATLWIEHSLQLFETLPLAPAYLD